MSNQEQNLSNLLPKPELKLPSKTEIYLSNLGQRANTIISEGYNEKEIMNVVMQDVKRLGGPAALLQIGMASQLSKAQFDICETIGVKLLAICAMQQAKLSP